MDESGKVTLFEQALDTMNRAIEANEETLPYKQLLIASKKIADGLTVGVAVYKEDPDTPHDYYTVRFKDNRLYLVAHGKKESDMTWKMSESYLEDLVNDPDRYIANPALLDWDWLKRRIGI